MTFRDYLDLAVSVAVLWCGVSLLAGLAWWRIASNLRRPLTSTAVHIANATLGRAK